VDGILDETEEIKRRKLEELQKKAQNEQAMAYQQQQQEAQKQSVLRNLLTPEARERLGRVKVARPDYGAQVENLIVQLAQQGQIKQRIDEPTLIGLLKQIQGQVKRDFKIQRL